jgi:predicted TIM-barrel fold metal-dependent hydrolase
MIIDAHVHLIHEVDDLVPDALGTRQNPEDLLRVMDRFGVAVSLVFGNPFYWDPKPENTLAAAAAKKYPDRMVAVGMVNPRFGDDAIAEMRRCVRQLGCRAIKMRPDSSATAANAPVMRGIAEEARALGVPLLVHTGRTHWAHPLAVGDLAKDHPKTQIVMQHMFDIHGKYALKAAVECPNLILETSGCLGVPFIREVVETIGSERVMFGSDIPALSLGLEIEKIRRAKLARKDEENVFYGTAARLWGLAHAGAAR